MWPSGFIYVRGLEDLCKDLRVTDAVTVGFGSKREIYGILAYAINQDLASNLVN